MSLNTIPQLSLTTHSSPDGSSILSSDSSKPTLSNHTFSTSSGSDCHYQSIKANNNMQPFTRSYSNSNPFASFDCDNSDPLPIDHNFSITDMSFSSLYGSNGNDNLNNNNSNNYNNNNNAPFNPPFNYSPFNNNGFTSCQNNAFNPYYNLNNNTNCDPSIVSFAPGRPRPGASSQICCVTAPRHQECDNTIDSCCSNYNEQLLNNTDRFNAPRQNNTINNNSGVNGEYVYNAAGDVIGVLEGCSNIITTSNGECNTMRPLVLPPIDHDAIPPVINVVNTNNDCNFTVLDLNASSMNNMNNILPKTKDDKSKVKQIKTITRSTMKRGRHISSAEKPFVCETCGKGYKYLCNYRSHCKIHTDDAFVCNFCNKRFGRKSNYKEHVRIHTGEAPYKCQFCDRTFKQHHGWKDHLRVHTGEKPYLCKVCGKRFTVGHNLNVHMRIHTGERPYTCDICKKSYRQKSAYNSHIKNVHGIKVQRKVKS